MSDFLEQAYPALSRQLPKTEIASLPTTISRHDVDPGSGKRQVWIKRDDQTSTLYGGNKIRKLEYLLQRAKDRGAERIATFGTVGSNHALATAIHANDNGLSCTCFLAHQTRTPLVPPTLNRHLQLGTELVRWGGSVDRLSLYRRYLQNRKVWVIPLGGSCWLGAVGFVNAGLELAAQVAANELDKPQRIYIANGTMGSVAGLAVGLGLAGLDIDIHAVRVAHNQFARSEVLSKLILKTATLLNRYDSGVSIESAVGSRIVWRDDFYAGGYAVTDELTMQAVESAAKLFCVQLDTTYTGKAMAAMLSDMASQDVDNCLFWNTYNSVPIMPGNDASLSDLPSQFERYFDEPLTKN